MSSLTLHPGFTKPEAHTLPEGWVAKKLACLTTNRQGGKLGLTKESHYVSNGVPAFSAAGCDGFVEEAEYKETEAVVLSAIGANCGRCFFASGNWTTLANVQAIIPSAEIDPKYLFYRVNQENFWERSGSAQPFIKPSSIGNSWVAFPQSKTRQKKIAAILTGIDTAIEKTEALIAKYQQIKAGLMHDLFTRGVLPNGQLRPAREQAPELYQETAIGWIPKEWATEKLENLASQIVDGVHHTPLYVEHGIPFVTVKNLTAGDHIDFSDLNYVSETDHETFKRRAAPQAGDVLVTKDGTLGVARIVESGHPEFSIFVSVALLRPIENRIDSRWLFLFFDAGIYEKQLGFLSAGTGLKHIHLEHFRRFLLPLPCLDEQSMICSRIEKVSRIIRSERRTSEKLYQQKLGLMQDLLTGKVPVKVGAGGTANG